MIWDLLNFVLDAAVAAVHALYSLLPASPLYVSSSLATQLATPMGYAAFFLPISAMLTVLGLYVVAVAVFVVILLAKQFIEAVIP
jgi:hypothetical protein